METNTAQAIFRHIANNEFTIFSANPPAIESHVTKIIVIVVVLVCGGVDRGSALPGDPGQKGQDHLRD